MDKDLLQAVTSDYRKSLELSSRQQQIVLGSLLGRGMIISPPGNRECYLRFRQSIKEDINLIAYKAAELKDFARPKAFLKDKRNYYWNSISHEEWRKLYEFCYLKGKKNVTMEWLDKLTSISLAIYYLDVGKIEKNKIELNVSRNEGKELILRFFNEVDCPCNIIKNKIVFTKEGTTDFIKIISQSIPSYLLYRIV